MHTRAKISVTFWVVASALLAIYLLASNLRWYYELEVTRVAALGMLLAIICRLWAVRQLRKEQDHDAQRRLEELQREVILLGHPVRIEGMGSALGLGQPLLIVSREGVQPAGYGLLPWSAVYGIECHTIERKYASGTVLNLYVPGLQAHLGSAHPFIRFFRGIPGIRAAKYVDVITIRLRRPSEIPSVIERLCRNLWQGATGRTHTWSIHLSDSEAQFIQIVEDTGRKLQEASRSNEGLEQVRMEMENAQRYLQRAKDEHRGREAWTRVWTVPGAFALALLVGQVPFGRLVAFVPTDAWSTQAFVIAAVMVVIAWVLIVRHARNVFGESFTRKRLLQVLVTLGLASILVLPMTWFLITDVGGFIAADIGNRPNEEMTVIATKEERTTRRSCDYVLSHPALGKRLCLVRAQFLTYPDQVPVVLSIRRNTLGYKVYDQRVALPVSEAAVR